MLVEKQSGTVYGPYDGFATRLTWTAHGVYQELCDDLQSTLEANVAALEIWMENQKRIATSLTEESA